MNVIQFPTLYIVRDPQQVEQGRDDCIAGVIPPENASHDYLVGYAEQVHFMEMQS